MSEFTVITSVLTSIKAATDIAKFLRESDFSLEKAELRLKLADLMSELADAKIEVSSVQDTITEKERRITELEEALQRKDEVLRKHDAYYVIGEDGKPTGIPMCVSCWEVRHKLYGLYLDAKERGIRVCPACGVRYDGHMAPKIKSADEQPAA